MTFVAGYVDSLGFTEPHEFEELAGAKQSVLDELAARHEGAIVDIECGVCQTCDLATLRELRNAMNSINNINGPFDVEADGLHFYVQEAV